MSSLILQNIEKIMDKCILSSCVQSTRPIDRTVSLCTEISRNTVLCRYRAVSPNKMLFSARYRLAYYVATIVGCKNILKYLQFTNMLHQIRISVCARVCAFVRITCIPPQNQRYIEIKIRFSCINQIHFKSKYTFTIFF